MYSFVSFPFSSGFFYKQFYKHIFPPPYAEFSIIVLKKSEYYFSLSAGDY